MAAQPFVYTFTGNGNWSEAANWSNHLIPPSLPAPGSEIIIDPATGGKAVLNVPYVVIAGARLMVKQGKIFEVGANLTFVK